jgi:hypothetical protein
MTTTNPRSCVAHSLQYVEFDVAGVARTVGQVVGHS